MESIPGSGYPFGGRMDAIPGMRMDGAPGTSVALPRLGFPLETFQPAPLQADRRITLVSEGNRPNVLLCFEPSG